MCSVTALCVCVRCVRTVCACAFIRYVSDPIRLAIGDTCSHLVVNTARQFFTDRQVFVMVLRSVGNLSLCDENVYSIVDQGVVVEIRRGTYHVCVCVCV